MKLWYVYVLIAIFIFFVIYYKFKRNDFQVWVINLDKDVDRLDYVMSQSADLQIQRFPAIVGADADLTVWLDEPTILELNIIDERKYRTRHYQLTRGAVGCFISHYQLYKRVDNMSLILEDDFALSPNITNEISYILANPPRDWDIILLGYSAMIQYDDAFPYIKVKSFWGMQGYLINRKGADKIIAAVDKIDAQIDSYLSWMAIHNLINIYAVRQPIVTLSQHWIVSNIQCKLIQINQTDAYTYNDTYLGPR